ncbi:PAS/PAC sensor signal transduction histidine kinase [Haloterrigena salina JCM 13891]|uniref:histidine kinase n=1 Tax=Haloterrigena salina JCM 13891 TaxID=1227488 RepID=M0C8V0_9EURY|nr:PAS domain S-box protein [Haloterrigena salina]ELZ18792.1 PAS/PAC sensor signal transduction histidine kinase [Haloterrigena salina JCM 13891]
MSERVETSDADWNGDAEALQQFRALVATVDGGVCRLDTDNRFVAVDDDFRELVGYERDELRSEHVSFVLPEADSERLEERLAERAATIDRRAEPFDLEATVRTGGGDSTPCELRIGPLTDDGELQGTIVVVRDVGERLRRRRRDRELEQYRAITEAASDVIVTVDGESTIRTINPAVEPVFGYEPDELVGESLTTLMPDGLADRHREALARYLDGGDRTLDWEYVELPGVRADGTEIPLAVSFSEVEYEGERYFTGIIRDVSEREARERELHRKERRYEAVFEDPNILVGLLEPDGTVLDINGTAMEYIDADLADVTGEPFWETPWWGEGDDVGGDVKRWTERAAAGEYVDFEADLTHSDGKQYTLNGYFRPVTDDDGDVVSIIVSDRDVTERREYERKLEERERQLSTLMDNVPGMVYRCRNERGWPMEFVSDACEALTGYESDALERGDVSWGEDVMLDEDRQKTYETIQQAADEVETFSVTYRIETAEGEWRWVRDYGRSVVDNDGDLVVEGIIADITERKERERELEQYRRIVETIDEGVYVLDGEGRFVTVNEAFTSMLGADRESLIGAHASVAFGEEQVSKGDDLQRELLAGETDVAELEERLLTDDEPIPVVSRFRPLEIDDDVGRVGVVRDITDRNRRKRELERYAEQLETLFDVLPVGVVVANADGEIVEANDVAQEIWGGDVFDADSVDEYARCPVRWADSGEPVAPEEMTPARVAAGEAVAEPDVVEIDAGDGTERIVELEGMPIRDEDGDVIRGVVTMSDITERIERERRLEELVERLEESNERLQQFAYAASHDLQEPLRMVSSYLQLIENRYGDDLDADGREFLEFAVDGAERMKAMIEGLLEYSRVDTRGDPLEPVALDAVLEEVLADLQFTIEEHDAEIRSEPLPRVDGDADQLRQLFQNLLDNAIEYSGDEPPQIEITAERRGDEWTVSVADEGIGLEVEDQERIFEVFQRLHSRDEHAGTGIGLALCERIVERHGGEIWVDAEPDEGATFSFTLPAADDAA